MTIRVVVVDDQAMVRMGFSMILSAQDDIEVVAEAADGIDAFAAIEKHRPDVVLLDIRMPRADGFDVLSRVSEQTKVVMVTTFADDAYVDRALELGASGFLLKDSGAELLVAGVRAAVAGDALISPEVTLALLARRKGHAGGPVAGIDQLSPRELDVVKLVGRGCTNAEIAQELFISLGTVKTHLTNITGRLGVRNRVELAAAAWRSGLVD